MRSPLTLLQFPQLLLKGLVLQALHQLCRHSLDTFQGLVSGGVSYDVGKIQAEWFPPVYLHGGERRNTCVHIHTQRRVGVLGSRVGPFCVHNGLICSEIQGTVETWCISGYEVKLSLCQYRHLSHWWSGQSGTCGFCRIYQAKHRDSCTLQWAMINHYQLEVVLWWLNTTKLLYGSSFIVTCHFTCSFCWITAYWLPIKLGEVLRWQFNWHLCMYLLQKHERRFVSVCREDSNQTGLSFNKWIKISNLNLFIVN